MHRNLLLNLLSERNYEAIGNLFKNEKSEEITFCNNYSKNFSSVYAQIEKNIKISINSKLLAYCFYTEDIEFLKELSFTCDINELLVTSPYRSTLIYFKQGKNILEYLLINANFDDSFIKELFHSFISNTKLELLILLLQYNYVPNNITITDAIYDNNIDSIKFLLENNCNVQLAFDECKFYYSDVYYYDQNVSIDMIKLLINYNISLSNNINELLFHASRINSTEILLFCINHELNSCDINTALKISCENNHLDTMKLLLQNNADINNINDEDLLYVNHDTMKFLIENGYCFEKQILSEMLNRIIENNADMDYIMYMVDIGADFNIFINKEAPRKDLFDLIIHKDNRELIKYLIENYHSEILRDANYLIQSCMIFEKIYIMEYLISVFELNYGDNELNALFYKACILGKYTSAEYLSKKIINVYTDENLFTEVIKNRNYGNDNILKLLTTFNVPVPNKLDFKKSNQSMCDIDIITYIIKNNPGVLNENNIGRKVSFRGETFIVNNLLEFSVWAGACVVAEFLLELGLSPMMNDAQSFKLTKHNKMLELLEKYRG